MRVQKYLSEQGILSRREAENFLLAGLIKINGKVVKELGTKIDPLKDTVEVISDKSTPTKESYIIYKDRGIVTGTNESEGKTIKSAFAELNHLSPIGRLDKESEGLLILSNDGVLAKKLTGENHEVEKEYIVTVREDVMPIMIERLSTGIKLKDGMTLPAKARRISKHTLSITLKEGRNHQVRRMCDAVRLTIESLKRIRIGNISLKSLQGKKKRKLTAEEITKLKSI